jgi:hypothetical protein
VAAAMVLGAEIRSSNLRSPCGDRPLAKVDTVSLPHRLWSLGLRFLGGEAAITRETANAALADGERWPDSAFACVADRIGGLTRWLAEGDIVGALAHLEPAVRLHNPKRDPRSTLPRILALRRGLDLRCSSG